MLLSFCFAFLFRVPLATLFRSPAQLGARLFLRHSEQDLAHLRQLSQIELGSYRTDTSQDSSFHEKLQYVLQSFLLWSEQTRNRDNI